MIIKVIKGYVSYKGELFSTGETVDIPDEQAMRLLKQGIAVKGAGDMSAPADITVLDEGVEPEMVEAEQGDIDEEKAETVAELPALEPEATVSKRKRKGKA
ncbi:hypothetical protein [uncultured Anaerovibrio sp.]|uniref:hypothetical protein n=1 Tax=uncultured Anaerovibrio sp. TaxID=361586 RepID=UPI002614CA68|nr:hypothetical protein [uncultured Anaerovibrio sp.]